MFLLLLSQFNPEVYKGWPRYMLCVNRQWLLKTFKQCRALTQEVTWLFLLQKATVSISTGTKTSDITSLKNIHVAQGKLIAERGRGNTCPVIHSLENFYVSVYQSTH